MYTGVFAYSADPYMRPISLRISTALWDETPRKPSFAIWNRPCPPDKARRRVEALAVREQSEPAIREELPLNLEKHPLWKSGAHGLRQAGTRIPGETGDI